MLRARSPLLAAELDALGKALKERQLVRWWLSLVVLKVSTKLTVLDSCLKSLTSDCRRRYRQHLRAAQGHSVGEIPVRS